MREASEETEVGKEREVRGKREGTKAMSSRSGLDFLCSGFTLTCYFYAVASYQSKKKQKSEKSEKLDKREKRDKKDKMDKMDKKEKSDKDVPDAVRVYCCVCSV